MNLTDWIFPTLLFGGALAAAVALVVALGFSLEIERRFDAVTIGAVPLFMCLGIVVSTVMSGRSLRYAELNIASIYAGGGGGGSFQRLMTGAILAICLAKIINVLWRRPTSGGGSAEATIFVGFLAYFFALNVLSPLVAGQTISHNSLYSVAIFSAVFVTRRNGGVDAMLAGIRAALLMVLIADLSLALVKPDMALQASTGLMLPGLHQRLWGVEAHPNGAGSSALVFLVLLFSRPFRWKSLNLLGWACGLAVLLLAQSKTVWVITVLVAVVLVFYRFGRDEHGRLRPVFVLGVLFALIALLGYLAYADIERLLRKYFLSREISQLESATGRIAIWQAAVDLWLDNPWFGFGPDAWGPLQRARMGMPFAVHAHNQALQVLTVGGVAGGIAFAAYFLAMVVASIRSAPATAGASLALTVFMLVRSMTEIPLSLSGLFSGDMVIHLTWFALVLVGPAIAVQRHRAPSHTAMRMVAGRA